MPEERPDILATFAWLKKKLPQYQIEIRNYTIPGLEYAIRHGEVDFFLETAGFYRRVYVQGLRDIATMITREAPNPDAARISANKALNAKRRAARTTKAAANSNK